MQMRQVKAFMKAKKPMWRCGECKCITLQCWKENDELCNCGDNVDYTPWRSDTVNSTFFTVEAISDTEVIATLKLDEFELSMSATITKDWNDFAVEPYFNDDNFYKNEYILEAFADMLGITEGMQWPLNSFTYNITAPEKLKTKKQIDNFMHDVLQNFR